MPTPTVTISTLPQTSSYIIEICSHLSEKGQKAVFFEPGKLENHTNEGKGKGKNNRARRKRGREEKRAMVVHLISFYNGYFESFWLKKTQCLTVTFLKIRLDMYDPEKKLLCSLIQQILNFLITKL